MRYILTLIIMFCVAPCLYAGGDRGIVTISVASLRSRPAHSAELETQALLGTPLTILDKSGDWYQVTIPNGYKAWIPVSSVKRLSADALRDWEQSRRVAVTAIPGVTLTSDTLAPGPDNTVCDLVAGNILLLTGRTASDRFRSVELPDGRKGFLPSAAVTDYEDLRDQHPLASTILDVAKRLNGIPYLWGGNSTKAVDCSGLTSLAYFMAGIQLPRNASQQARIGTAVDKSNPAAFQPGDLIFFANPSTGRVNHVGIAMGDGRIIHSSGRVRINSLDPSAKDYIGRPIHSVRRILATPDARGIGK